MISVIIPVYNCERYLNNCIDSVIKQDYKNLDIICINDASTDTSLEILKKYQQKDQRIKIINLETNRGLSFARNVGLNNALGKYVLFVDSDDELEENAITNLYNGIIKSKHISASIGKINIIYEANEHLKELDKKYFDHKYLGEIILTDEIVNNFYVCAWGILYKRSEIERIKLRFPDGLNFEDNYWHWCFFTSVKKIVFIENIVYRYFRRKNSITTNTYNLKSIEKSIDLLLIAEKICYFWKEQETIKNHEKFALQIIENMFFNTIQLSKDYEKAYAAYKCAQILRKFNFSLINNKLLSDIKDGKLGFLYTTNGDLTFYFYFLKIYKIINRILPAHSKRKKIIFFIGKNLCKILLNMKKI